MRPTAWMPMRCSTRVPMMLRVRPAQLMTTVVSASISFLMSVMRKANSPPGMLRPPGMQKLWYSSGVRVSRMTSLSPFSILWWRSSAVISGTWWTTSCISPKSLLGTFTPHSVGRSLLAQRLVPPSK